jgi:hypothetical protein
MLLFWGCLAQEITILHQSAAGNTIDTYTTTYPNKIDHQFKKIIKFSVKMPKYDACLLVLDSVSFRLHRKSEKYTASIVSGFNVGFGK